MDFSKIDEEKLREAACYGDIEAIQALLKRGVNVNAQHSINGWTALHWSVKRNNFVVSKFLLTHGADPSVPSFSMELPADLTTNPAILNLLGSLPSSESKTQKEQQPLPIVANYLAHPEISHKVETNVNKTVPSTSRPTTMAVAQNDELVIKLRLAYSSDPDFIEVEMNRSTDLTYSRLMEICCAELNINQKYVERLRKLPDTRLRRDADIRRLKNFQEIEVVLVGSKPKPTVSAEIAAGSPIQNSQPILY